LEEQLKKGQKDTSKEYEQLRIDCETVQESLNELSQSNADLHKSLREKAEKERSYKDWEQTLQKREKALKQKKNVNKTKVDKPSSGRQDSHNENIHSSSGSSGSRNRFNSLPFMRPTWDPLLQHRNLFPFPWLALVLFFLLFLSLMRK